MLLTNLFFISQIIIGILVLLYIILGVFTLSITRYEARYTFVYYIAALNIFTGIFFSCMRFAKKTSYTSAGYLAFITFAIALIITGFILRGKLLDIVHEREPYIGRLILFSVLWFIISLLMALRFANFINRMAAYLENGLSFKFICLYIIEIYLMPFILIKLIKFISWERADDLDEMSLDDTDANKNNSFINPEV